MKFKAKKKNSISEKQKEKYKQSEIDIAYSFSKEIFKEFGNFIRAIVLFGSNATNPNNHEGDIDILLVVDDVSYHMTPEIVESYRLTIENTILKVSKRIHVTTLKFTSFWDYIRLGDPVGLNILRDGVALIDTGFFTPMQMLLYNGEVRPSNEAVMSYISRAPQALHRSRWHLLQATLDLYWSVIDAAQAAIMKAGEMPPNPADASRVLEKLVSQKLISKKQPKTMAFFYKLGKQIIHHKKTDVNGKEYEDYYKRAKDFVDELKKFAKGK
ncbi:MAG: nucleotidyltransferase domain-containing protein [Nanobdellota archaeon]